MALFFDQTVACLPVLTTEGCEILAVEEDAYEGQGMQFSNVLPPQTLLSMALPDRLVFFFEHSAATKLSMPPPDCLGSLLAASAVTVDAICTYVMRTYMRYVYILCSVVASAVALEGMCKKPYARISRTWYI